jgi:hypothetical protein
MRESIRNLLPIREKEICNKLQKSSFYGNYPICEGKQCKSDKDLYNSIKLLYLKNNK